MLNNAKNFVRKTIVRLELREANERSRKAFYSSHETEITVIINKPFYHTCKTSHRDIQYFQCEKTMTGCDSHVVKSWVVYYIMPELSHVTKRQIDGWTDS